VFKTPQFWQTDSLISRFLRPFSWLYHHLAQWRESRHTCEKVSVPVICVGNLVMGGAGKTPTVITIVKLLQELGHQPHILSRGYGGYFREVAKVDNKKHSYLQVGDEPLLLSQYASTWIGISRVETARAAIADGASILVMDDGLQSSRLVKDFSIIVVDTIQGLGNNRVFPAGPLREPIQKGLERAQVVVLVGSEERFKKPKILNNFALQYTARLLTNFSFDPQPVVAFAGIGCPEKFRYTLESQGFTIKEFIDYADHHPYTIVDMHKLQRLSKIHKAPLITTEKDHFRIPPSHRKFVLTLPVSLQFDQLEDFRELLRKHFGLYNQIT
jgi:tetraacyldisaccharide 4'-kinase